MNHSELHLIDLLIIGASLITMVSVGVYCVRRVKNTGDYYVAGRSLGPMVLMATVCATIIGGSGLMGRAGVAYSSGSAVPGAFACGIALVVVSLLTCKKHPSVYLKAHKELPPEASAE